MLFRQCCLCLIMFVLVNGKGVAQEDDINAILAANPDPFADINAEEILQRYGENGSGIKLKLGGIALQITNKNLVSNKTTIDGATNIVRASSGFGFIVALSGDYLFEFDKHELNTASKDALSKVLELYNEYGGENILIEGHTDSKGSDEYNQNLSEQRAESVYNWFIDNGLSAEQLSFSGLGETQPIAQNEIDGKDNPKGRALNRRVELTIKTTKKVNSLPVVSDSAEISQ